MYLNINKMEIIPDNIVTVTDYFRAEFLVQRGHRATRCANGWQFVRTPSLTSDLKEYVITRLEKYGQQISERAKT